MAGLIPSEVVATVLSSTDIVDLIGGYLPLTRAGRSFKALCPFHSEKTPSFMVNPDRQIFHCFGCGEGGDAARFLMRREGFSFPEAIEFLAQRAGISLPRRRSGGREQEDGRLRVYEVQRAACEYFRQSLQAKEGEAARAALAGRGILPETVERFQLGYAPDAWEGLVRFLTQRGFPPRLMEAGGLVIPRPGGKGHYDRFRDRLMIPIQDPAGKVLGFGGRALGGQQEPKYLNSPETPIYRKGHQLFGVPVAARALRETGRAIVVEGYFDCIALQQAGILEAVAVLGTALTREQVLLLRRYVEQVTLVFDPDRAGLQAAWRGLELLMEGGLGASIVALPEGTDPDGFIRKEGVEPFRALLASARDLVDFDLGQGTPGGGVEGAARAADRILAVLARLPDGIRKTRYVQKLAERLGVPERAVLADLARLTHSRPPRPEPGGVSAPCSPVAPEEKLLLQLLLLFPVLREGVRAEAPAVQGEVTRSILEVVAGPDGRQEATLARALAHHPREDVQRLASELLVADPEAFPEPGRMLQDCLERLRLRAERPRLKELQRQIAEAAQRGDREAESRLLAEYQERARRAG